MVKFKLGDLAKGKPVDEGTYRLSVVEMKEETFESGSWGFIAQQKIVDGQEGAGRSVFTNYIIQDPEGKPSKALFRFAQLCVAAYATDDIELDPEDRAEVTTLAEGLIGHEFIGEVIIEPGDVKLGYQDKNQIKKYAPIPM